MIREPAPAGGEVAVCAAEPIDSDGVLACALARDVDRAFESVVIAYRECIVTFVARMLQDDGRAEDVAQDVFLRAYHALRSYTPERRAAMRLRSWLFTIAHNLTRNAVRDGPPPSAPLEYGDGAPRVQLLDEDGDPHATLVRAENWAEIGCAVDRLSAALRPAFVLRYIEELSYDEIAQALAEPVGTVKSSAHRGLLAVRAYLEKHDD